MPLQREACPEYDVEVLYDALLTHARTEGAKGAFAFGGSDAIRASHAVRGAALLGNSVLEAVLTATPHGMVMYTDLKMCIKNIGFQMPELQHSRPAWRRASLDDLGGSDGRTADGAFSALAQTAPFVGPPNPGPIQDEPAGQTVPPTAHSTAGAFDVAVQQGRVGNRGRLLRRRRRRRSRRLRRLPESKSETIKVLFQVI